jgi:hypothetical protein
MKLNKLSLILAVAVGLATMIVAQPVPTMQPLPISSQDVVRNAALDLPVRGYRSVSAPSMNYDQPGAVIRTNVTGNGAEDILDKLFEADLRYTLANTNDTITGYVSLFDANNNQVFSGYASYHKSDLKGEGGAGPLYNIWMETFPLLEGVESAEILAMDEDGETARRYPQRVNNKGQVMLNPWMAGAKNGLLVVKYPNGSMKTFPLFNPAEQLPGIVSETQASWKIEGHHVIQTSEKDVILVKIIEPWVRPTVLLPVQANQLVRFDVAGMVQENGGVTFERPPSFSFEQVVDGDKAWAGGGKILPDQPSSFRWLALTASTLSGTSSASRRLCTPDRKMMAAWQRVRL